MSCRVPSHDAPRTKWSEHGRSRRAREWPQPAGPAVHLRRAAREVCGRPRGWQVGGTEARRGCRSCDRCRDVSSRVTTRRVIPNSFDGSDHAAYRAVVDRYLTDERVAREESQCRAHAAAIVDALPRGVTVKTSPTSGRRTQCARSPPGSAGHRISRKRWSSGSGTTTRIEVGQPRRNEVGGRAVRPHEQRTARDPARRADHRRHQ